MVSFVRSSARRSGPDQVPGAGGRVQTWVGRIVESDERGIRLARGRVREHRSPLEIRVVTDVEVTEGAAVVEHLQHLESSQRELRFRRDRVEAHDRVGGTVRVEPAVRIGEDIEFELADAVGLQLLGERRVGVFDALGEFG
jgi:hypothetical protein